MSTISSVSPSANSYLAPVTSSTTSSTSASSSTAASSSSVAQTSNAGLAQTAVTLSSEANIVAMMGGVSSTYNATGLLNSLVQAATETLSAQTPTKSSSSSSTSTAQTSSATSSTSSSTPTSSASSTTTDVYNSSGVISTNSSWASILKANPALASTVSADTFDQSIVGTLSTSA